MASDKYMQNRQLAYNLLKQEGYTDIGNSAEELFKNKANSELAYRLLSEAGYTDIGKDYNEFANMLYGPEQPSRPTGETGQVAQMERLERERMASAGEARFNSVLASRRPETSSYEQAPEATRESIEGEPVKGGYIRHSQDFINTLPDAEFIKEYDKRWEKYQQDTDNELHGPDVEAQKEWLDANNEKYRAAQNRISELQGQFNLVDKDRTLEEIAAKKKENQSHVARKVISTGGIAPGYDAYANRNIDMGDSGNYEAANEILGMAEQTLKQGSKADPGYKGNWLEQSWTAAKQFVEGGANNFDMGSLTFGLTEGSALTMARRTGEKSNKLIQQALDDMGYKDGEVDDLLKSMSETTAELTKLTGELNAEEAEIKAMGTTLDSMMKSGAKQSDIKAYTVKYKQKLKDYNKRIKNEYQPLYATYEKDAQEYETLMSGVDAAVENGLSDGEKALLDALEEYTDAKMRRSKDVSVASAAGAGAEQSAEFMLDFILTGGFAKAGTKAAAKLASKRLLKKTLGEKGAKIAAKGVADAGVAAARTAAMFPRNLAAYGEQLTQYAGKDELGRYNFDRSHLNAALNTALTQYIEYWSEGFGEYFGAAEQALFKNVTKAAPRTAIGKTLGQYRGSIGKYLDHGKFDGMFNEMLEEVVGSSLNAMAGWMSGDRLGDKDAMKEFFAGEQLATLALSFLPMSAISASTNLRAYNKMKERYNKGADALNPFLESGAIKREELEELVSDISDKTPEQIKDKIVDIADKARKSNGGYLPKDFTQNLMGYIEGSFAMSFQNETWEDSQEKLSVVGAYTNEYESADERRAYDITQLENKTREQALNAGFSEDTLDLGPYALAYKAQSMRESAPEQADALMEYATVKAAKQGLVDGYNRDTREMYNEYEDAVMQNININGKVIRAQYNTPNGPVGVFVITPDVTINSDGTITTPTGADSLVAFRTEEAGPVFTAKADNFTQAFSESTDDILDNYSDALGATRAAAFGQAEMTMSPTAKARTLANMQGQTVFVRGNGAYEPVQVVRMTNDGENIVISGDKEALKGIAAAVGIDSPGGVNLEIPVESLWNLLATNDDGTLATEKPEGAQADKETPSNINEEELRGSAQVIDLGNGPVDVFVTDISNGYVRFDYDGANGETVTGTLPVNDFLNLVNGVNVPAKTVASETPAPAPAPAPAEPAAPQYTESGILLDENGEPVYDAPGVTPEQAYDDIYGKLKEKNADAYVLSQSNVANKALADAQKLISKGDADKAEIDEWDMKPGEGMNAFLKRQEEAKAKVDETIADAQANLSELERKKNFWDELREVAEENIAAREAEAKRQELIEKYGVDASKFDLTPQTAEEAVAEYLGNNEGIIDLEDAKREVFGKQGKVPAELFRHLGSHGILTSSGGRAIQDVANDIVGEYETLNLDQEEVRNTIIDFLARYTKTQMRDLIFQNRLDAAIAEKKAMEAPVEDVQQNGTSAEETIPAEEAVEEAPEGTEVPEPEVEVKEPENKPERGRKSGGKSVTSQETEEGVPASAADIKTKEQARVYFEGLYGKGKRADNSVRVWELTHKKKSAPKQDEGVVSNMAMSLSNESGLTNEEAAELITLGTQLAEDFITEDGLIKFPQFFKNLVETFGDGIRPFSKQIYLGASANVSDEIADQMDDRNAVRAFDTNIDLNDISDEQESNTDVQQEPGGVPGPVADTTGAGSGESGAEPTDTGTTEEDGGGGGPEVGILDGGNDTEPDTGSDGTGTDGTPGRTGRGRNKANDGVSTGKGSGRRSGSGQRGAESGKVPGRGSDRGESGRNGVDTEAEKEAKAKAQEDAAYEAEKERIKDETDTKKLKSLKDEIKAKLSDITDKYDEVRAQLNGQLRAVLEKLQQLFSNNANKSETLAQEKVPYAPVSDPEGTHAIGSVVPSGAADYMRDAVKRLEAEVGKSVAEYVKDELGYKDLDDMFTTDGKDIGLSAEQVDAVGLAIHQMKTGRIFVVGDMTGVGKGRVGAALIRWAKKQSKKVIFCTEQPNLFTAMYNDIADIGGLDRPTAPDPVPWIIGNGKEANITDENDGVLVSTPSDNEIKSLYSSGEDELPVCPGGRNRGNIKGRQYDFVMTTYSQLQATEEEEEGDSEKVKKKNERNAKGRQRLDWLKKYAKDAIIIMDESHTAAGENSTRGENAKKLVEVAQGVTFMSATFAKTPQAMGLYAIRSSMNDAMITRDQLIAAIDRYGIPMQEILAAALFKTGEMVRRERDFDGVKTNWLQPEESYSQEEIYTTQSLSDKTVDVINAIIDFQRRYVEPVIDKLNKDKKLQNEAKLASGASDVYIEEYSSTPYSGQVSNVIGMMLFALKAKKAAEIAIEQIKKGEKPVIAVDNTLGAYVDQIEGNIDSADFGAVLMKGLAFAMKYQLTTHHMKLTQLPNGFSVYKKVPGDKQVEKYESIEGLLGEPAIEAMETLAEKITEYGKETLAMDLPLSPIDYIKKKIADAGYKCGEITKRQNALVQNPDGTWRKEAIKHNKKDVIKRFNGGSVKSPLPKDETYDAVVMNRSGATGNSMHASRRFGDQRPRKMIILQAAKDPNNEVQIRGRIDRTGQVHRGEYFYIISPIPAEKKITMMLKQKLASLDANSVGSEKVASNKVEAEDMDNKYGDEVARDFLVDHEEIHLQMDPAKQMKRDRKTGEYKGRPGLLYDLLLSMQRMTVADQETILTELEEAYAQKIEYLNQNGINDLATTTMNLEAVTIDSAIMIKGKDNEALSEFAHDTTIERVEVNVLRKPLRSEDIHKKSRELGVGEKYTKKNSQGEDEEISYGDYIQQKARDAVDVLKEEKKQKQAEAERKMEEDLRAQTPKPDGMTDEQYDQLIQNDPKLVGLKLRNANEYTRYAAQLQEQLQNTFYATKGLHPGWPYKIPLNESDQAESRYGRFMGFKMGKDGRPKSIEAVFATRDSRAMVSLPVVNMHKILESVVQSGGGFYDMFAKTKSDYGTDEGRMAAYDKWWDKMTPSNTSRSLRYMITGNILQAAGVLFAYRGTITTFTRKDTETGEITVDKGLLLAEDFEPENFMVRTAVTKDDVWDNPGEFSDEITNISVYRDGNELVVKFKRRGKEKLINHPVMYDEDFKALCNGDLETQTNQLVARVSENNAAAALEYLYRTYGFTQGHLLVMPDSTDKPDRIIYTNKPYKDVIESLKPKYRAYGSSSAQQKIDEALKEYKMDITNEDLKNKIRELVQLRQAFLREDYALLDDSDLAWNVIIKEQEIEKLERPVPNESPEQALDRRKRRDDARNLMEAYKEELYSRGFKKGTLKHFKQGKTDLDTIKKTFDEFNSDPENAKIAKKAFDIIKKLNVNIFFNEKTGNDTGGYTAGDLLAYNWRFMNEDWIPDQLKANTILHEMLHTATVYAIRAVENGQDHVIPGLVDAANQAKALYNAIYRNGAFKHQVGESSWNSYTDYGAAKNAKEMLSETGSNQSFRDDLAKVKVLIQSSFGQIGFSDVTSASSTPSGTVMTALDASMDILNRLLDGFNPEAYRKMWAGTGYGEIDYREGTPAQRNIAAAEEEVIDKMLDSMSEELGMKINRISRNDMPTGHKTDKGYYNPKTGEMSICMDNVTDLRDAIATVFHETVGHHGLRMLFGPRFNEAMVRIYANLDNKGRAWVSNYMQRHNLKPGDEGIIIGMEEYLAHLAERGDFKQSAWDKIKEVFGKIVDLIFGTENFTFTDRELNYILRASYEHLKNPEWLNTVEGKAKDTIWKRELGINETDPNKPTDPDGPGAGIRFRDGDTGVASEDYNSEMQDWHNAAIMENQNADLPVKIGMDKIMKEVGKTELKEDEDFLTRHNLSSSRAETEAHNFELFRFKPLLEQVRVVRDKLITGKGSKDERTAAYERVLDYLYAVSALERNAYKNAEIEQAKQEALRGKTDAAEIDEITKRYDAMKRDWSGLTSLMGVPRAQWRLAEAKARAMVNQFKKDVADNAALDELWNRVRSCTDFSLDHAYKYGLLTRDEYEKLHGTATTPRMWNYYLPLRGFNEKTAEEEFNYSTFVHPSINSVVVKKMNGRWSQADNPLANILNIAETEIVQGNDNYAKQALYRFVLNAGENSLLTLREPWYVKNPATGKWSLAEPFADETLEEFEERMRQLRAMEKPLAKRGRRGLTLDSIVANKADKNEHLVRLKVGGIDKMIWVNGNPAIAKAVSGIGRAQNMQQLRRASRALSNLFTTYSLDFTAKNLLRDTIYSRMALMVKEDKAYRSAYSKNWWNNFGRGAFAYPMVKLAAEWESGKLQQKDEPTPQEKMFMDFMRDGGQTGYTIINSVREIKKELDRSMRRAGEKGDSVTIPILGHYAKGVKTLNEAFELLTRFTAYQTSREMGRSGQRAASDAKEISVNFNRRGAQSGQGLWGQIAAYLGATHYFYNAGVQGFDNFLHLFKVSPKKMTAYTAGFAMMGVLTPMLNAALAGLVAGMGGDGDDDWYWNLPEWVRRNNIVIGTGKWYVAIPLPVELRAPYGLGDIAGSAFMYDKTPDRKFGSLAGDILATASGVLPVNPIEGINGNGNLGDAVIRAVVPDAGMFFVDWATNRDYTGRPLWKENPFSDTVPKSQGAYASTPRGIVAACQKLSELSYGSIDIAPGLIRDLMNNYGGGFFRAAEDLSKIVTGIRKIDPERPLRYDNIPFFSGFTGHIDEDRSNSFASSAMYDYKKLSEGVVRKMNAVAETDEITPSMAYDNPESLPAKARVQRILEGEDYILGKMYRDGMNNEYVMKQRVSGPKAGQWYKSRTIKRKGVATLKKEWKALRDQWAEMPHDTPEEKSARDAFSLKVQEAWHLYYDAEADLVDRLMEEEYNHVQRKRKNGIPYEPKPTLTERVYDATKGIFE